MRKLMTIGDACNAWDDDNCTWEDWANEQLLDADNAIKKHENDIDGVVYDYAGLDWDALIVVDYGAENTLCAGCSARFADAQDDSVEKGLEKSYKNGKWVYNEAHFWADIQIYAPQSEGSDFYEWKTLDDSGFEGKCTDWKDKKAWEEVLDNFIDNLRCECDDKDEFPRGEYRIVNRKHEVMAEITVD